MLFYNQYVVAVIFVLNSHFYPFQSKIIQSNYCFKTLKATSQKESF